VTRTQWEFEGIILAGSHRWSDSALERTLPRPLLPVALRPLISYAAEWLQNADATRVTVCANSATVPVREALEANRDASSALQYYEDESPRGPAGCIRDASLQSSRTVLVADGTAIPTVNVAELLEHHQRSGAAVTTVVHPRAAKIGGGPVPSGIYVFDRRALEFIPERGFQDVKETLIPRLYRAGERVATFEVSGACPRVMNPQSYLAVNQWVVERLADETDCPVGYRSFGQTLAHTTAHIALDARLVGPVLIGPGARVLAGATIVGPAVIGEETTVGAGALVSRAVTWRRSVVDAGAILDRSVLMEDAVVPAGAQVFGTVKAGDHRRADSIDQPLSPEAFPGAVAKAAWSRP
jgi:NDP-sugar pyrophosphorylase family protein